MRRIKVSREGEGDILVNNISDFVRGDEIEVQGHGRMKYAGSLGDKLFFLRNSSEGFAISVDRKFVIKGTRRNIGLSHSYALGLRESKIYKETEKMLIK